MIHPIAGKCKHCKSDLANLRGGRPAAAQALPSIIATNTAAPLNPYAPAGSAPRTNGHANGHNAYAPIPIAAQHVAMPMQLAREQYEANAPILPQRVSARMATTAPRPAWWKSWPLVVIVLAVLAIVTAVVLMVWPPGKPAAADNGEPLKGNKAMPAPDRMETNPLPPKTQPPAKSGDPWRDPGAKIDIPDDPDDDLAGGGTAPTPPSPPGRSAITGGGAVMLEVSDRFCTRAATCSNDRMIEAMCAQTRSSMRMFDIQPPTSCAARSRCLAHVDSLDCSFDFSPTTMTQLTIKVQDCVEAFTGC